MEKAEFVRFDFVSYEESLKFDFHGENREVKSEHLNEIIRQSKKYFDIMPPITVNVKTNKVIDGQHRLRAYQDLVKLAKADKSDMADAKIKVMFISIPEEDEMEVVVAANNHSKKWTMNDYVESYAKGGNTNYQALVEFCRKKNLARGKNGPKYSYGAILMTGSRAGIKEGAFVIERSHEEIENIYFELQEIQKICNLENGGYWVESLGKIWPKYRKKLSWEQWEKGFEKIMQTDSFINGLKNTVTQWKKHLDVVLYLGKISKPTRYMRQNS